MLIIYIKFFSFESRHHSRLNHNLHHHLVQCCKFNYIYATGDFGKSFSRITR
jgi:hypothetical protein